MAAPIKAVGRQCVVEPRLEMFELNQAAQCGDFISSRATAAPQTGHQNEVAALQLRPNKTLVLTQPHYVKHALKNRNLTDFSFNCVTNQESLSKVHESTFLGGVEWDYLCKIKLRQKANRSQRGSEKCVSCLRRLIKPQQGRSSTTQSASLKSA